jgi:hypothetical protein
VAQHHVNPVQRRHGSLLVVAKKDSICKEIEKILTKRNVKDFSEKLEAFVKDILGMKDKEEEPCKFTVEAETQTTVSHQLLVTKVKKLCKNAGRLVNELDEKIKSVLKNTQESA